MLRANFKINGLEVALFLPVGVWVHRALSLSLLGTELIDKLVKAWYLSFEINVRGVSLL